jgi:sugar/nucleoside kinase (ribokinase family)
VEVLKDTSTDISVAFTCPADRGFLSHMAASRVLDTTGMESPCLARTRHLHLCLSHTDPPEHWRGLIRQAHDVGTTVSVDLGWQTSWDRHLCRWLGEADVVFPNETEALHLAHTRSVEHAMEVLGEQGALIVVKRGAKGAGAYRQGVRIDVPPFPVREILDPTGAGDMFAAGFLWAYVQGHSMAAALAAGGLCGARCVEQIGGLASPPSIHALKDAMRPYETAVVTE